MPVARDCDHFSVEENREGLRFLPGTVTRRHGPQLPLVPRHRGLVPGYSSVTLQVTLSGAHPSHWHPGRPRPGPTGRPRAEPSSSPAFTDEDSELSLFFTE
eukprot:1008110-Rhodomonas_salina.1